MAETTPLPPAGNRRRRTQLLSLAAAAFALIGVGYLGYWYVELRHYEQTDDAYVQGNLVQITPQVTGIVVSVNADDTDFVKAGAPLVALDRADADVALAQAQAALAQTVREVRGLYATNATWNANVDLRQAEVARVRADLAKAEDDLKRRQGLDRQRRRQRRGTRPRTLGCQQRAWRRSPPRKPPSCRRSSSSRPAAR